MADEDALLRTCTVLNRPWHSPDDLMWVREMPVTILVQCETLTSERAVGNSHHVADGVNRGESGRSSRHITLWGERTVNDGACSSSSGKRRDLSGSRAILPPARELATANLRRSALHFSLSRI